MNKLIYVLALFISLSSCEDWLDIKPKTNVEEDDLFKNEQGFKEALTGVYINMSRNSLYGQNLTYGFIDFLAQRYLVYNRNYTFSDEKWYQFEQSSENTLKYTNTIWSETYNLIANLNNLISNIESRTNVIFTDGYKDIIKGEAIGLRSFLYFDLLRMYGPIYKSNPASPSIPYRTSFDRNTSKLIPANALVDSLVLDLKEAEVLLENDKMDITFPTGEETSTEDAFLRRRFKRMNKYAVKALLARLYLYKGDKTNAAAYAEKVIDAKKGDKKLFSLVTDNSIDHLCSTELIFSLSMDSETFGDDIKNNFVVSTSSAFYIDNRDRIYELFDVNNDGSNDMRMKEGIGFQITIQGGYTLKYSQDNYSYALNNTMPLIRLPEMYYIMAECCDDLTISAKYINKIREARGLDEIILNNQEEKLYNIEKEYRKEFYAEGQLWYFYKRHGYTTFQFCPLNNLVEANYRFCIPEDEVVLGNIK